MPRSRRNSVRDLEQLIALWDTHSHRGIQTNGSRHPTNVAMVSAFVNHSINLARGVLAMHAAGLNFESISLVRSTMECVVTASWHTLYPEKTRDFITYSAVTRRRTLREIIEHGMSDDTRALDQVNNLLAESGNSKDPEGKWLKQRFLSIRGGWQMYLTYEALCAWDHATSSLTDAYTAVTERSASHPSGMILSTKPEYGLGGPFWVEMEASLVLRAQMAMDQMLEKPRNKTQLAKWAKRFGVAETIEPVDSEGSSQ